MSFSPNLVVSIRNASIFQDLNTVLNDVSFDIEKGEFVYLIGRTGSGKSSLLKTMYADLPLQMGDMHIAGYDIRTIKRKEIPFLRRKIGIIFQDFQLFPDRSVAENLFFVMKATGWKDKSKMKSRMTEVLMRVGLGSVATKLPHQLSGGEQQRIVIARALLNEPALLIADEPTGNLDPEVSDGIMGLFKDINRTGTAVLMATHNHSILKDFPGRILKCQNGRLFDSQKESFSL
jgi:cell division transport system ATP-binding protein